MKPSARLLTILFLSLILFTCRKPYNPPATMVDPAYLVVEGVINSGSDSTIVLISRTRPLDSTSRRPETGAKVIVESNQNSQYPLVEASPGAYVAAGLNLPVGPLYRLHIYTAANKEYISDFVENKITPPIDSVSHQVLGSGVQFYVNTHDPANNTRYYRWEYGDAWTYTSEFDALLVYKNGAVVGRSLDSLGVDLCYKFDSPSNNIFIGNSSRLSKDIIENFPLGFTATGPKYYRFQSEYAFTVKQYALTPDAYKFWQLLQTNTQNLGTIFDAQPSSVLTNLHCVTNPGEAVVGYVSVSTVTLKRVFFTNEDFNFPVAPPVGYDTLNCGTGTVLFNPTTTLPYRLRLALGSGDSLVTGFAYDKQFNLVGYEYAPAKCVDCRLKGGTNVKPSYWPF